MALDTNAELHSASQRIDRTNTRIDELKASMNARFEDIDDRRRSDMVRLAAVLAVIVLIFYLVALAFVVNRRGVVYDSGCPTTAASRP